MRRHLTPTTILCLFMLWHCVSVLRGEEPQAKARAAWAWAITQKADDQPAEQPGKLIVHLPADASLIVQGDVMQTTGTTRRFTIPPFRGKGTYQLQAEVVRFGLPYRVSHEISVEPGKVHEVDLRSKFPAMQASMYMQDVYDARHYARWNVQPWDDPRYSARFGGDCGPSG